MSIWRATAVMLGSVIALAVISVAAGYELHSELHSAKPKPMFPTYAQVTEAGTVLTHDLDISFMSLASAPDFVLCDHKRAPRWHGVVRCVFLTTFSDDTSSYYAVYLDRADRPVWAEKLKGIPAPQAA